MNRGTHTVATWIDPQDYIGDTPLLRLPTPSRDTWTPLLRHIRGGRLTYLSPGYGPDDDPGVGIVRDILAPNGKDIELVGGNTPEVLGPVLIGPAHGSWRPDPSLACMVRGIRDKTELHRWRTTIATEFGDDAMMMIQSWPSNMWRLLDGGVHSFPAALRVEATHTSIERSMSHLRELFGVLRGPNGCPWDQEQTHSSLRKYILEEAAEVVDAIDNGCPQKISSELGDVLANIALHVQIAGEAGTFTWPTLIQGVTAKMTRRHPHVFGGQAAADSSEVAAIWRRAKMREGTHDQPDPTDSALPALAQAAKLVVASDKESHDTHKSEGVEAGQRWLETHELAAEIDHVGDLFLGMAIAAKRSGVDPELALRRAIRRSRHLPTDSNSLAAPSSANDLSSTQE